MACPAIPETGNSHYGLTIMQGMTGEAYAD